MEETLTLSHTIALLAYRDDSIARAVSHLPSNEARTIALYAYRDDGIARSLSSQPSNEARIIALPAYRHDSIGRSLSRLPSNEALNEIRDERQLAEASKQWDDLDKSYWSAAKDKLLAAVKAGRILVIDSGEVEPTFWLTHNFDSADAQHFRFRRSDLDPLLREGGGGMLEAWIRADQLFQLLEERGIVAPTKHVMPALRSGELIGWLGSDENAAIAWTPIETHWFVLGMEVHRSGRLTRQHLTVNQYAAFRQAPGSSVWFVTEDLRGRGLVPHPIFNPRRAGSIRAALQTRLKEVKRHERRWVRGADLADHFARQRGAIPTPERQALHDEACQQIFQSLLHGDFTDEHQLPHVRPHRLNDAGFQRMTPEMAEQFRGKHSDGRRDRDGELTLSDRQLREFMRDVLLPARCVIVWCQQRNMHLPDGLDTETTSLRQMMAGSSVVPVFGMDIPNGVPDGPTSSKISNQPLAADTRGASGQSRPNTKPLVAAPRMAQPKSRRKSSRQRLIDALIQIHDGGTDITHGHRDKLHSRALAQAGIGPNSPGSSRPTFERALSGALDQISARCSN